MKNCKWLTNIKRFWSKGPPACPKPPPPNLESRPSDPRLRRTPPRMLPKKVPVTSDQLERIIKKHLSVDVHIRRGGTVKVSLKWDGVEFSTGSDIIPFPEFEEDYYV